eukprot:543060_1
MQNVKKMQKKKTINYNPMDAKHEKYAYTLNVSGFELFGDLYDKVIPSISSYNYITDCVATDERDFFELIDNKYSMYSIDGKEKKRNWMNVNINTTTSDTNNSWLAIHCHEHKILLTHYTLKQGSFGLDAIRSWKLQGGNDGTTWTTIDVHNNYRDLSKSGSSNTWEIPLSFSYYNYYNYFRILMLDDNCDGNWKLHIGSIKFYGHVINETEQYYSKICGRGKLLDNELQIMISTTYDEWCEEKEEVVSVAVSENDYHSFFIKSSSLKPNLLNNKSG